MRLLECDIKTSRDVDPSNIVSYEKVVSAYYKGHPRIEAQLIPAEGLNPGSTTYNCAPWVNGNGDLKILGRVESSDPNSEISHVRSFDFTKSGFVVPNGLVIAEAQDPSVSLVSRDRTIIGVVAITEDLAVRGRVAAYWPQLHEVEGGAVSQEKVARGSINEKDTRVAFVGSFGEQDLTAIVARERRDDGHKIRSYLQVGIVPTARDMPQLSYDIAQVKNDLTSRLDVLTPDNRTWFGPNQIIPLQSEEDNLVFGLLFHTGRLTNRLYENGERGRVYTALVTEISADPKTRQVTHFTKPKIIATADVFPYTQAKRPDLCGVYFSGGFVFGMKRGLVEQTILLGGLRDRYNCWAKMAYPFSRPLNVNLNRLFILPVANIPTIKESYSFC